VPLSLNDGFEDTPAGAAPAQAAVSGEQQGASIAVSTSQAAGGKQSLQITDSARLEPSWQPHFYYEPHYTSGTVRQAFDVWIGPEADFFTEWRDTAEYPRNVGPSIRFDRQGRVTVAGRVLATVPTEKWAHVEVVAAIGKDTPRRFTLTLAPAGEPPQVFADLPIAGDQFHELHWLGFSSTAAADAVFYLDNLVINRTP
jgi:hypothetical protein